jgi:DNA polymerase III epsilon subunit-like protein
MLSKPLYKRILVIDFETRWDRKDYTLSKMTTEQYIRDERFKAFGVCMKFLNDEEPAEWVPHDRIPDVLKTYNWNNTAVLAHNAQFDVAILSWVYGVKPCFVFDSLSMARALRGIEVGNSLAKLADEYGLPPKGNAVHSTDGLLELTPEIEKELADYCAHDTYLCEEVFKRLVKSYPVKELRLIDLTLKMFINPVLELDKEMLNAAITKKRTRRTALLTKLGIEETALASNQQFADVLLSMGVSHQPRSAKLQAAKRLLSQRMTLFSKHYSTPTMKMWRSYVKRGLPLSQRWSVHGRKGSSIFLVEEDSQSHLTIMAHTPVDGQQVRVLVLTYRT